jgi:hypothetical protein
MMVKQSFALLALLVLFSSVALSSDPPQGNLGFGVILGAPSGLTMRYHDSPRTAIQCSLGGSGHALVAVADYIKHVYAFRRDEWSFYYGPGAFLGEMLGSPSLDQNKIGIGIRGVFGVNYKIPANPFDVSLELGPSLMVAPKVGMGVGLGISFRYYPE